MYVFTYIRMYVCMYVCMYVHMYVCTYVCMYVRVYVFFVATSKPGSMTSEPSHTATPTSSTHKGKLIGGIVFVTLFMVLATCVLSRCGDIEPNPGPGCEHVKL